jgi:hypothetical protein
MAQAGSRRPLTAEARVRAPVSPYDIRDGQSFTMTGIFPSSVFYRVSTIPPWLFILVYHLGHKNRTVCDRSSETHFHPIDINNFKSGS